MPNLYRPLSLAILSLAVVSMTGCGGAKDPFSYVKEHGKVTFTDGSLIQAPRVQVVFVSETPPADPKFSPPLGVADVKTADGTFDTIMSHINEGVVVGKHKVLVKCYDAKDRPLTGVVAPEYLDVAKTPLEADTNDPASFNFTVKKYTGPPPGMQGRPGVPNGHR